MEPQLNAAGWSIKGRQLPAVPQIDSERLLRNPRLGRMGLCDRFHEFIEGTYDDYMVNAHEELRRVRRRVRSKYGDDRDTVRPKRPRS